MTDNTPTCRPLIGWPSTEAEWTFLCACATDDSIHAETRQRHHALIARLLQIGAEQDNPCPEAWTTDLVSHVETTWLEAYAESQR